MKQKHKRNISNRYMVSALAVLVVGTAVVAAFMLKHNTEAAPAAQTKSQLPQRTPGDPQFSFNANDAPNWRQGPTDKVSMVLFHNLSGCFTSVQHKQGTVDATAELQQSQDQLASTGASSTPGAVLASTLQTNTGKQEYKLHQYSVSSEGSSVDLMGGLELGYLPLSDGYVKIEGHCNTADELPATIPALKAIEFDPAD